jgi:hypothetical protein
MFSTDDLSTVESSSSARWLMQVKCEELLSFTLIKRYLETNISLRATVMKEGGFVVTCTQHKDFSFTTADSFAAFTVDFISEVVDAS